MFSAVVQPSVVSLFSSTSSAPLQLFTQSVDPSLPEDSCIHLLHDESSQPPAPDAVQLISPPGQHDGPDYVLNQTVLQIQSPTLRTTYIQCPHVSDTARPDLGIKHPWVHVQVRNMGREWAFEVGIVDHGGRIGILRLSTFQVRLRVQAPAAPAGFHDAQVPPSASSPLLPSLLLASADRMGDPRITLTLLSALLLLSEIDRSQCGYNIRDVRPCGVRACVRDVQAPADLVLTGGAGAEGAMGVRAVRDRVGPAAVNGVDNLKVVTTVTNTGNEALRILNEPRSPLSTLPADTFRITAASGASPAFTGIRAKYVAAAAIAAGDKALTRLAPGESVEIEHDRASIPCPSCLSSVSFFLLVSKAYNFTHPGEGTYSFEANNLFHIVDASNKAVPLYADAEAHTAKLTGTLAIARSSAHTKRATFNGCTVSQQTDIGDAISSAQAYVVGAIDYLTTHLNTSTRYTTWFGSFISARRLTVLGHYNSININGKFSTYTYDCTCTKADVFAYVYPDTFGVIYLCNAFWNAPSTGTDSKAGTIVHEASHFTKNGGTRDYAYGQTNCKALATQYPDDAVRNADSHEYFAENNPVQT
ncbi:hypothetical protein DXG03_003661 [Asterophora parasitica]|uniref:Lysine-specific metallo-endopeptidase domain-containing protein n=1 Tax=Asterophora parasitica TaxID=117018 RepID=A0A9P7GCU5_9AGAR|nr:hypothetical protein DXG03_003661 [Asterophora parasitica]